MAEKGKVIQINFDSDVLESSIAGNENSFTVSSKEHLYVPGTIPESKTYSVSSIGKVQPFLKDSGLANMINNGGTVNGNQFTLFSSQNEQIGPTTYNTGSDSGENRGVIFEVTGNAVKLVSVDIYPESSGTTVITLHRLKADNTTDASTKLASRSISVNAWGTRTLTLNWTLQPGYKYFVGNEAYETVDPRYYLGGSYPFQGSLLSGVKIVGNKKYNETTIYQSYMRYYNAKFASVGTDQPSANGIFKYDLSKFDDLASSLISWSETIPADTTLEVSTGLSSDDITEPITWNAQSNNSGISGWSVGDDLSENWLWVKVELAKTGSNVPIFEDFSLNIMNAVKKDSLWLLIDGWSGINKATENIRIQYNSNTGTLAGDVSGNPQIADFDISFLPTDLFPANNPAALETVEASLTSILLTRIAVSFVKNYPKETAQAELVDIAITRTHIDDLDP